jgi:bacillithiol biosynthesis deacetylase BshB1
MILKLDVLAFAAHPDDVELGCAGTVFKLIAEGKKVGITDLTGGERGTRGNALQRTQEAERAAELFNLTARSNLGFKDCFFENNQEHQLALIRNIRFHQPEIVLINAPYDRHPDHGRAEKLVRDACFLSGLPKIETRGEDGANQPAWRPKYVFSYIQDHLLMPTFVVDITPFFEQKLAVIQAYESQFYNPKLTDEPETYISNARYLKVIEARARTFGHLIGVEFGEGFIHDKPVKVNSLMDFIASN